MRILFPHEPIGLPEAAVFDFDGTLSKLRAGWEGVMAPLMREVLPGDPAEVAAWVTRYIDESTGVQTILQMKELAREVERRGGIARDPWEYKAEYNRRLMVEVARRRDAVTSGDEPRARYTVAGAREFVERLHAAGVALYAASGTDDADVRREAEALGFAKYFREISGAVGEGCSKEAVLKRLIRPGAKLLVVGDGKVEIALGRAAGALTLGLAANDEPGNDSPVYHPDKARRLEAAGAHALVPDFSEAEAIFSWM